MSGPGCLQSPGFRHGWLAERGKRKPLAEWAFGFDVEVHCIHLNLRLLPILRDLDITYVRVWRHPARLCQVRLQAPLAR